MTSETSSPIERIKEQLDIVAEIGAVVPLKKSGKAYKGLCPFHGERTPSFYVFPEHGTWHCFGCNEGGDLFTFVEKQQGIEFREALALLAERAGVPLESGTHGVEAADSGEGAVRQRLRALNEAAAIWFYSRLLQAPEARYARDSLNTRGVSHESLTLWRLGYAPSGDALSRYLQEQGYTPRELVEAGLAREPEASKGGDVYDYFRNRLIFPIRDARGQTIAFGGRELDGSHPKYLNTPQTPLFDKSATLFGLDLAREAIRRNNRVIIVEGYMDAIITHQYGSRNVVACIGSAITEKHIRQIKKLTRRVTLALDPDAAGDSATLHGITVAQQAFDHVVVPVPEPAPDALRRQRDLRPGRAPAAPRGIVRFEEQVDAEITVMRLPPHEDPDEFVRRDPAGWQRALGEAVPLVDYLIEAQTAGLALDTPQGKLEARRRLLPIIAEVRDRTLADEYVGRLAQRIRLDKIELRRDLQRLRQRLDREAHATPPAALDVPDGAQPDVTPARVAVPHGGVAAEVFGEQVQADYCLGLLLEYPDLWAEMRAILGEHDFTATETRALFQALAAAAAEQPAPPPVALLAGLPAPVRAAAERARARATAAPAPEDLALTKVAAHAAYRLKRMRLKAEMAELDALQRDAEQADDAETLRTLLRRKQQLLLQRRAIDAATTIVG